MNQLVRFDTNALNRALVGFDTLFDNIEKRFANQVQTSYPPYNVLKRDDDNYEIQIAVSGFNPADVTVSVDQNELVIEGSSESSGTDDTVYLHRGLATRNFTRSFTLAEHMEVGEGKIKNGILTIAIKRVVPDALKPRTVRISAE